MDSSSSESKEEEVLAEGVPVNMPELPTHLVVNTTQQFKALGDPMRWRILGVITSQPATAKQVATLLKIAPGTAGHHLQVLEAAGLARVVARRLLVHGIVAKYYTRSARLFIFDYPTEVRGTTSVSLDILAGIRDEMTSVLATGEDDCALQVGFPHIRLAPERAQVYAERLQALLDDFLDEASDPAGQVYGLGFAYFKAPPYMQTLPASTNEERPLSNVEREKPGGQKAHMKPEDE